jgi:hypothetical protein
LPPAAPITFLVASWEKREEAISKTDNCMIDLLMVKAFLQFTISERQKGRRYMNA